ncbi:MAG: Uncharacterised protein [Porticoccaceae bacterium UBA1117]|nr:MAG: Uncharacterised protein [Porticoccaceae bacterium UBA1117]
MDPNECTPKKLCEFATDQDGSNIVWSDASNKMKHVRFAQSSGMNCGVITIVDPCDTDPNECKISQLCEKATIDNGGQTFWNRAAQDYVDVAKEYGMTCGVPAKTTIREFNLLETEANNTPPDADDIVSGKAIIGQLHSSSDKDYFAIVAEGTGTVSVIFETSSNSSLAYYTVSLVDSDGNILASQKTGRDTKFSTGISNADTYYVVVSEATYYTGEEYKITAQTTVTNTTGVETEANNTPPDAGLPNCVGNYAAETWSGCSGQRTFPNGAQYVGEFMAGLRHGKGTHTYSSGSKYVGNWGNDKRNGQGIFETKTAIMNIVQDGLWENDVFQDEDKIENSSTNELGQTLCPGSPYDIFQKPDVSKDWNACLGEVYWAYSGGGSYLGGFENGAWHGQGTFKQDPNEEYVGEWQNNQPHGQGTYTYSDGTINEGNWENGVFQN